MSEHPTPTVERPDTPMTSPDDPSIEAGAAPQIGVRDPLTPNRQRDIVENDAYFGFMRRGIRAAGRRVANGDVEDLGRMLNLRDYLDEQIAEGVHGLRRQGESWANIGRGAGITRQSAQERWGKG